MGNGGSDATRVLGEKILSAATVPGSRALVAYLMAGFPNRAASVAAIEAAVRGGADIIELGVPFADPLSDDVKIVEAARIAQHQPGGFGMEHTLALAAELTSRGDMPPIVLVSHLQPIMNFGLEQVASRAVDAGVAGVIVSDLAPDAPMGPRWLDVARAADLGTILPVFPNGTPGRVRQAAANSRGFIYVASSTGVTVERRRLPRGMPDLLERVRSEVTGIPIIIGFRATEPVAARTVALMADGVVVGSPIVARQRNAAELEAFVTALASEVHRSIC